MIVADVIFSSIINKLIWKHAEHCNDTNQVSMETW